MRTIRTKVYLFSELSKEAQEKAIEWGYDLNVSHEWWDGIYEDAETIGLKITGFDIDRANYCEGNIIGTHEETAMLIKENHGETCKTYTVADTFLALLGTIEKQYKDDEAGRNSVTEEAEEQFLKALLTCYLAMLNENYEYLTSKPAIIEAIEANEYEFTADGNRFHS